MSTILPSSLSQEPVIPTVFTPSSFALRHALITFFELPLVDMQIRSFLGVTISVITVIVGIVLILTGIVGLVTRKKGLRVFVESLIEVVAEFFMNI